MGRTKKIKNQAATLGLAENLEAWDIPGKITAAQLQFFLPLSRQSLSEIEKKGIICRDTNGRYNSADTLKNLIKYYRTVKDVKEEVDRYRAEKLRIQVAAMERSYLPVGEVKTCLAKCHSIVAERLNDMPEALATVIAPENPESVVEILRSYVSQTMDIFTQNIRSEFGEPNDSTEKPND
jgi:hypothetical protein